MGDPIGLRMLNLKLSFAESLRNVLPAASRSIYKGLAVKEFKELQAQKDPSVLTELQVAVIGAHLRSAGYDEESDLPYQEVFKLADKSTFDRICQSKLSL